MPPADDAPTPPTWTEAARLAADLFDAPIAAANLIAVDRQWFKAGVGVGADTLPLDASLCAHAIFRPDTVCVLDTAPRHERATRPEAEIARRESERRLDAVLDNIRMAGFLMDGRQHCEMLGSHR